MKNGFVRAISGACQGLGPGAHHEGTTKNGFVRAISGVGQLPSGGVDFEGTMKNGFVRAIPGCRPFPIDPANREGTMKNGFVRAIPGVTLLALGPAYCEREVKNGFVRAIAGVERPRTSATQRNTHTLWMTSAFAAIGPIAMIHKVADQGSGDPASPRAVDPRSPGCPVRGTRSVRSAGSTAFVRAPTGRR